jgi:hypothetical protein
MSVRLIHVIGGLLAAIFCLIVLLLTSDSPEGATGMPHPEFPGMNIGGEGLARLAGMGWVMASIQVLTLLLIYSLIALGVPERLRTVGFWWLNGVGCALSLVIWAAMYLSYLSWLETGSVAVWLGFPLPTTLMLFGVFLAGSYLCGLYVWGFRRFILTEEDEAAYEALRAEAPVPRQPEREEER